MKRGGMRVALDFSARFARSKTGGGALEVSGVALRGTGGALADVVGANGAGGPSTDPFGRLRTVSGRTDQRRVIPVHRGRRQGERSNGGGGLTRALWNASGFRFLDSLCSLEMTSGGALEMTGGGALSDVVGANGTTGGAFPPVSGGGVRLGVICPGECSRRCARR